MNKLRILSLFSGIGAFEKALKNIGIDYDLVGFSEIDKYAVKSYCAVHGVDEVMNLGDITQINTSILPKDIDLITYGFPCQSLSVAGKRNGFEDNGEKTASGLFFDALRIIEIKKPKIAIAENVKNLTSKRFKNEFEMVLSSLKAAGYNNYWKVLNAKDYGVPQNRERVFIISIRKDVDDGKFIFPDGKPLQLRLKDILEPQVDEKFYLSNAMLNYIDNKKNKKHNFRVAINQEDACLESPIRDSGDKPMVQQVGQIYGFSKEPNPMAGRVYDANGLSPTVRTSSGGNHMPKIIDDTYQNRPERVHGKTASSLRAEMSGLKVVEPFDVASRGRYLKDDNGVETNQSEQNYEPRFDGVTNALTSVQKDNYVAEPNECRIRKLTPKECWRLMGFDDADFEKAEAVCSNTQLYRQAGNSIVVNVLEKIFENLYLKE